MKNCYYDFRVVNFDNLTKAQIKTKSTLINCTYFMLPYLKKSFIYTYKL